MRMLQIGRYLILKELGRGAMGIVYAASDPNIGRTVAIKTISIQNAEGASGQRELRDRLRREAQSAGVLSHPGIVTIFDMGEQGDDAYIVMEYVEGSTLEEIFVAGMPQHSDFLFRILGRAGEALDYAHGKGIIHRDIKPSNIMIAKDGCVKITDFGVAKISTSTSMTSTGIVIGTPNYMSPEQAQALPVDGRSDQFSLAVLAHRVLTGKLPFFAPTLTGVLSKILWSEPDFSDTHLPAKVRSVLLKALSKDPALRFPTCAEFARELERTWGDSGLVDLPAPSSKGTSTNLPNLPVSPILEASEQSTAEFGFQAPVPPTAKMAASGTTLIPLPADPAGVTKAPLEPATSLPEVRNPVSRAPRRPGIVPVFLAFFVLLCAGVLGYLYFFRQEPGGDSAAKGAPIVQKTDAAVEPSNGARLSGEPSSPDTSASMPAGSSKNPPDAMPSRNATAKPPQSENAAEPAAEKLRLQPSKKPGLESASIPSSGIITWTGRLKKNSIVVISDKGASVGSASGRLPGFAVRIEVEPPSVVIRVLPNEKNGWKEIIFGSGSEPRESITIRWIAVQ